MVRFRSSLRFCLLCAVYFVAVVATSALTTSASTQDVLGRPSQAASAQPETFATSTKPFNFFSALAAGSVNIASGACADVFCNGTDSCNCLTISSLTLKAGSLGRSTISCELNNDTTVPVNNGSGGVTEPAGGICTITAANGSLLNLQLNGWLGVVDSSTFVEVSGGYTITGGTAKFSDAAGTGTFALSVDSINLGTANGVFSLSGAFRR